MQFIYLLLSIYWGRKNPLFFLIFPIALVSGPGAFIDPRTVLFAKDIFTISTNLHFDVIIIYMFLVVFYLNTRCKTKLLFRTPMFLYGLYIVFLIVLTFANYGTKYESINVMRLFIDMILGYFLTLLILSTANEKQFVSFINMLLISTGILSIFYVINSAKILPLFYQETLYQEIDTWNGSFVRDFSTIPYFSHFLFILAFALTLFKSKIINLKAVRFVLLTYPFVLLYTFTRSLLIGTIFECILIGIIIIVIKRPRQLFKVSKIKIIIGTIIAFTIFLTIFNNEVNYFSQRVDSAQYSGANEGSVVIRIAYHLQAYEILNRNNTLLLGGGLNKKYKSEMDIVGAWTADSTIPFLLLYTGLLGVAFYYLNSFHFLVRSIRTMKKRFNPFSLALFSSILFSIIASFLMGGYIWGDPFIYFTFALVVAVENLINKNHLLNDIN